MLDKPSQPHPHDSGCCIAAPAALEGTLGSGHASKPPARLPRSVAGVSIPDSPLSLAAASLCFSASPEGLYNHCIRTYVFSALLYQKLGKSYDPELVFVGSALHDLGFLDAYMSPDERFELDGADAAMNFMQAHGVPQERSEIVWDAIALHTNLTIAMRKAPEIAMVGLGAAMDVTGIKLEQLTAADVERVYEAFPRSGSTQWLLQRMIELCQKKPLAYALHPFAEVARRHVPDLKIPTVEELMADRAF